MKLRANLPTALLMAALALQLAACSPEPSPAPELPSPSKTEPAPTPSLEAAPSPTKSGPKIAQLGEAMVFPSASITLNGAERRDIIEGEHDTTIVPNGDGTLWLLSLNWTNLSNEAVSKVCWGPYVTELRVFDNQGREMLLDDNSGFIPGNDCTNGLMTGQSGDWYQAFQGLAGAQLGYITIQEGYSDAPIAVVLDPAIELTLS